MMESITTICSKKYLFGVLHLFLNVISLYVRLYVHTNYTNNLIHSANFLHAHSRGGHEILYACLVIELTTDGRE